MAWAENQYPNDKDIRVKVLGLELGADKGYNTSNKTNIWVLDYGRFEAKDMHRTAR